MSSAVSSVTMHVDRFTSALCSRVNVVATRLNAPRRSLAISDMCADDDVSSSTRNCAELLPYGVEIQQIAHFCLRVLTGTHDGIPGKSVDFVVYNTEIIGLLNASPCTTQLIAHDRSGSDEL